MEVLSYSNTVIQALDIKYLELQEDLLRYVMFYQL